MNELEIDFWEENRLRVCSQTQFTALGICISYDDFFIFRCWCFMLCYHYEAVQD